MRKLINYCKESFVELTKKTTWPTWEKLQSSALWPTWEKLQSSALLVLVTTVILAAVLWAVDFAFQKLMTLIYTL